jgi:hypothetical protein
MYSLFALCVLAGTLALRYCVLIYLLRPYVLSTLSIVTLGPLQPHALFALNSL